MPGLNPQTISVTIANGASLSSAVDLNDFEIVAVQMPASWTPADLSFQGSVDNSTFQDIFTSDDAELVVEAAQARYVALMEPEISALKGCMWVKVRSGVTAAAVNQAAARTLTLVGIARS